MTVAVESIEKNDQYHLVTINGGMEEQYGLDLKLEDDAYRTMTFDDYPVYYEMGEKTMPLAGGVVLKDSSADPQAEEMETPALRPWRLPSMRTRTTGQCIIPRWWCRAAGCRKCAASGCRDFSGAAAGLPRL